MTAQAESAKAIFLDCIENHAPEAWPAFLDEACAGDAELRRQVEKLLRSSRELGTFHERTPSVAPAEAPGSIIGPYKLIEQIGEGGMGLVFLAEQSQPVRRLVALKVLKPGLDTRQVVARFEAERQALALMDHPNIAKILDAGQIEHAAQASDEIRTLAGAACSRPYFVMELVRGVPITEFCDAHRLDPRRRLALFADVCRAVQHAHTKGVIHRDLKPSNVLVTLHDTVPVPKVIDFGIAKATGERLTDRTLVTQFSQVVGTPLYMSPEQAEMNGLDVDTRSDVYALGVLLYELLTGATPFDPERLRTAGYDEARRILREEEPPRPSQQVATLSAAAVSTVSERRGVDARRYAGLLRGDLDWIVMKALEKDRNRRYESASALAADVERYLADEAVEACPPSAAYRVRKFAGRHRGLVSAIAVVLFTLIVGIAGTTWGLVVAKQNAQQARNEGKAKDAALKAEQQARADETLARQQAFAALRSMTADVIERKFAQGTVLTDDDRAFLRGVITQYNAFSAIKGDDADSRAVQAEGHLRVGQMRYRLGELVEAEKDYNLALSIYKQLSAELPGRTEFRQSLGWTQSNLGNLLKATGRLSEAERAHTDALALQKLLVADFPTRPDFQRDLAATHNNLGMLLNDTARPQAAQQAYAEALTILKNLVADFPTRGDFRRDLAANQSNLGVMFMTTYRFDAAETAYAEAIAIYQRLCAEFPGQPEFRHELAKSFGNMGILLQSTRRKDRMNEAEAAHGEALAIFKQLSAEFPTRPEFRQGLALSHNNLAGLRERTGRFNEAEQSYLAALSLHKQLAADFPNQPDLRNSLAGSLGNLAMICIQRRDFEAAKAYLAQALPHHQVALQANAKNPLYREFFLRGYLRSLIAANAGLRDRDAALRAALTVRDLGWDPPGDAHYAAHALALCIPIVTNDQDLEAEERRAAEQFYGDEAMNLLRDAVEKGWKNAALVLNKDPALAPLRHRDEFKKLLAEVEAARE